MKCSDGYSNTEDISPIIHTKELLTSLTSISGRNSHNVENDVTLSVMGQKERNNDQIPSTNYSEIRCQSLPDCVKELNESPHCIDKRFSSNFSNGTLQPSHVSELWFKTWPERCDKQKSTETSPTYSPATTPTNNHNTQTKFNCDILGKNNKNKVTLNEALKNISLAYSPVTKQLHLIEKSNDIINNDILNVETKPSGDDNTEGICINKNLGHRRTEAGSFSSTISTISEPSSNGSLLSTDDRSLSSFEIPNSKTRKKSITTFLSK